MKINNLKIFIYILTFFVPKIIFGQDNLQFKTFPSKIESDMSLQPGNYLVNGTCVVSNVAKLTIVNGVNLFFQKDAMIEVNGLIEIKGVKNDLVNLVSIDPENQGKGILIKDVLDGKIKIEYARFKYLEKPLKVEKNWFRDELYISNCVFKFSDLYGSALEINDADNILSTKPALITLVDNTFSNNSGSMVITNISSPYIKTEFKNNVITRNEYIGRDRNGMFTSPMFFNYNYFEDGSEPIIFNNSIFDNYSNLFYDDTLSVEYTNICAVGNRDRLEVSNNYFGDPKNKEIEKTFDLISANYKAPYLFYSKLNPKPDANLNGHFYKCLVNKVELNEFFWIEKQKNGIQTVELTFNRPVINSEDYKILYHYLDKDTLFNKNIKHKLDWSEGNRKLLITINEQLIEKQKNGYLYIDGFFDENGKDVPALSIGKKQFLKQNNFDLVVTNFIKKIPKKDIRIKEPKTSLKNNVITEEPSNQKIQDLVINYSEFDSTIDNSDSLPKVIKTKDFWEIGLFIGNALYWGDLVTTTIGISPRNARPANYIMFKYHLNHIIKTQLDIGWLIIAGTDDKQKVLGKQRGTGYERGLSFTTRILDINAIVEIELLKYRSIKTYVPSISVGVNAYNFKPFGWIDNKKYDLRPIGTEGQTLADGSGPYKKWGFGIPLGFNIKRHLNQKTVIALSYTYNKIFTDYLDDVSTGYYPDETELKNANPFLGEKAVKLSNPNNLSGQRSSSDKFDGYGYWGFTISRKLY